MVEQEGEVQALVSVKSGHAVSAIYSENVLKLSIYTLVGNMIPYPVRDGRLEVVDARRGSELGLLRTSP